MKAPVDYDGDVWMPTGLATDVGQNLYRRLDDLATEEEISMLYGIQSWTELRTTAF